jgi:hypothetical protein
LGSFAKALDPSLTYVLTTTVVALVGVIFVVRRTPGVALRRKPGASPDDRIILRSSKSGYFTTYGLCEALALFGLALRFMGFHFPQTLPYYAGGFVLLFFFRPREPGRS